MKLPKIEFGDTLTCTETGKQFIAAPDGCSANYAYNEKGEVFSDEGVDIREKRELLDRTKPFTGYVSQDGKRFTGWKGNTLGTITAQWTSHSAFGRKTIHYQVRDVHGGYWHGKHGGYFSGAGCCLTVRASKSKI